jgi:hypothetical protein
MWGGMPCVIASVIRILRKSCGENRRTAGVGDSAAGQGVADQLTHGGSGDRAVLAAEVTLEQQRHRRVPDPFVIVIGRDQRDGAVFVTDAADDGAEHVGQFGADHQQPFGVGLGRRDLQQRDEFAGGGQLVVDEAVVGKLSQFLDPDAGVAQHVDRGQRPERLVFLQAQVASLAAVGVLGPGFADRGVGCA